MNHVRAWDKEHGDRLMFAEPLKAVKEFFADFDDPTDVMVLEVGCGAGSNAVWLANEGFNVYAFDSSPNAILRLLEQDVDKRVKACVCDATGHFPFGSGIFDVVLDVRALENLTMTEAMKAYGEIARVMGSGALLLSITASAARDLTTTTCGRVRRSTKQEMFDMIAAMGLEVVEMRQAFDGVHDLNVIAWKD